MERTGRQLVFRGPYVLVLVAILGMLLLSSFPPSANAPVSKKQGLTFNINIVAQTEFLNPKGMEYRLIARVDLRLDLFVFSNQTFKDAGEDDEIVIAFLPRRYVGNISLSAVDEAGEVLDSQTTQLEMEEPLLRKALIRVPEFELRIGGESVTHTVRTSIEAFVAGKIDVQGPATASVDSLKMTEEFSEMIGMKFESIRSHVTVTLSKITFVADVSMEVGVKEGGVEVITRSFRYLNTAHGNPNQLIIGDYNGRPLAKFTFRPQIITRGEPVHFQEESSDEDGEVISWNWTFGDGTTSEERDPTHRYMREGVYTVTLRVVDDIGGVGSMSQVISVSGQPSIILTIVNSPTALITVLMITLSLFILLSRVQKRKRSLNEKG